MFKSLAGIDIQHVPYKGSAPAITDLIGGQIQIMFDPIQSVLSNVQAGKLRAVAVSSKVRSPALPDVPTIAEAGLPGYESLSWSGVAVPAGTPKDVIARLNRDIAAILTQPDIRDKFAQAGADPIGGSPQEFAEHIRGEREKWSKLIRERGIAIN